VKKIALLWLLAFTVSVHADFSVLLDAGRLRLDTANPMPLGSLLVLIRAGGDNSFSNSLAPGQYVSGNDVLLSAAAFSSSAGGFNNSGGPEETNNFLTNLPNPASVTGDLIALRWFPQITYAQFLAGTTPVAGQNFGTYNPLAAGNPNNNPDLAFAPDSSPWAVPSTGAINLDFFTTNSSGGGTQLPSEGFANFTVAAPAVPEPSTYLAPLLGSAAIGMGFLRRRFKH
jgi:hypothetical protein